MAPVIRAGETYALPRDMTQPAAITYWFTHGNNVFVAEDVDGRIVGTYVFRTNQQGGGSHVCNCAYITAPGLTGRGVAHAMCQHSLALARQRGFLAMQFNFVVSSNHRAVALWQRVGFEIVGRLPRVFRHPQDGLVDAYVMYLALPTAKL